MKKRLSWAARLAQYGAPPEKLWAAMTTPRVFVHETLPDMPGVEQWWDGPGWYFLDEVSGQHGPFATRSEAVQAQQLHLGDT